MGLIPAVLSGVGMSPATLDKIRIEADYIVACQYVSPGDPAHGAINDVYGKPTWVVPSEVALAALQLNLAARLLGDSALSNRALLAAGYLLRVQDSDGAWYDQYNTTVRDLIFAGRITPVESA